MEEFLLQIDDRIVRVLIDDSRTDEGATVALVSEAPDGPRVLPTPKNGDGGSTTFPGMPRGLAADEAVADELLELRLDVSDLPGGVVPFALDRFANRALDVLASGANSVDITTDNAPSWGGVDITEASL